MNLIGGDELPPSPEICTRCGWPFDPSLKDKDPRGLVIPRHDSNNERVDLIDGPVHLWCLKKEMNQGWKKSLK